MNGLILVAIWGGVVYLNNRYAPILMLNNYAADRSISQWFCHVCVIGMTVVGFFSNVASLPRVAICVTLCLAGTLISLKALHDNPFFGPHITAPPFRIVDGTYACLEHPGYFGFSVRFLGMAYLVNTVPGFVFFCAYTTFLAMRVVRENQILRGL